MTTFLQLTAADLFRRTGGDFRDVAIVFPNKRAGLFFSEHLARLADRPIWSPAYMSISELFQSQSNLQTGDSVKLVCDLHRVFTSVTGSKESLDDFFFWGETLLSDFDDADKNMADTAALFSNLRDLNQLASSYDFLEEGQRDAIRQFFRNFSADKSTELKRRFSAIWNSLGEIYSEFKKVLLEQGIAYEGMLFRSVTESLDLEALPYKSYAFVGFNVLNKTEHRLFTKLNEAGRALFYWDYDSFYLDRSPHEAGEFLRRNLRDFPSCLPRTAFDNLGKEKAVCFVESPTENAQARYVSAWVKEQLTEREHETAVVLCDESLLLPVLHAIPDNVQSVNVTMGYPLSQTPVSGFTNLLLQLHTDGYDPESGRYDFDVVSRVLQHPSTLLLAPQAESLRNELIREKRLRPLPSELKDEAALGLIFTPAENNLQLCQMIASVLQLLGKAYSAVSLSAQPRLPLYRESVFRAYTVISRFCTLIESGELQLRPSTLRRLVGRVLSATSIPFHGEPAVGMQVMGVLETRNLDFRHALMLSVSEGQMPKGENSVSFVPYNLRRAFGMTTIDHKISVYAYYFYRLLQRAESITLCYTAVTEGVRRSEMSRFMLQLLVEWQHPVRRIKISSEQRSMPQEAISIKKSSAVMEKMRQRFCIRQRANALLSPTALNAYLDCPLKFFLKFVAKLSAPEEVTDEVDASQFGSIFHSAAEQIYKDLTAADKMVSKDALDTLLKDNALLQRYVDQAFRKILFSSRKGDDSASTDELPRYSGLQTINSEVALRFVRRLLTIDSRYAPFMFVSAERKAWLDFDIAGIEMRIGGIIDRIDSKGDTVRIVDYKTGGKPGAIESVAALFSKEGKREGRVFQTFFYSCIICPEFPEDIKVRPSLLYIHHAASGDYSPDIMMGEPRHEKLPVSDIRPLREEFMTLLFSLLKEIFSPEVPFTQTKVEDNCKHCDFKALCGR